jgi:hypothetical protein
VSLAGRRFASPATPAGQVVAVDPPANTLRIRLQAPAPDIDPKDLIGRVVHFQNELRRTAHPIAAARRDGDELVLATGDDLLVGRARVTAVGAAELGADTALPLAPVYRGVALSDTDHRLFHAVRAVAGDKIQLVHPLPAGHPFRPGRDVWLVNVGPGDRLDVPPVYHWSRQEKRAAKEERNNLLTM